MTTTAEALQKQTERRAAARKQEAKRVLTRGSRQRVKARNRDVVEEAKATTPCADCQKFFPSVCMDFHHVRGNKKATIARMVNDGFSTQAILYEMKKCVLICANCHRIRHFT